MRWSAFLRWGLLLALFTGCSRGEARRDAPPAPASGNVGAPQASTASASPRDALEDGDIVFQESPSRQSEMVRALTGSEWTHMGVIFIDPSGPTVLEAVSPVRYTKLAEWIAHGRGGRYVVKRLRDPSALSPEAVQAMRAVAAGWLGRPYDLQFRWGDDALYCSELVYKVFERGAHTAVGRLGRAEDMNLADPRVRSALAARFAPGKFDPAEPVVTPRSIYEDEKLEVVR